MVDLDNPMTPSRPTARDLRSLAGVLQSEARAERNRQGRTTRSLVDRAVVAARGRGAQYADACRGIGDAVIGTLGFGVGAFVDEPWPPDEAQQLAERLMCTVMQGALRIVHEPPTADRRGRLKAFQVFCREMAEVLADDGLGEPNLREVLRVAVPNLCKLQAMVRLRPPEDPLDPE